MSRNVVIVESPAKAKTIKKYLGKDFEVMASYGHVRDLVPKEGAVDPTRKFAMRWEIIDKNRKHVDAIARAVKKADALYLSTDPDREGEAISWHLYELLKDSGALDGKSVHRSVFYEITRNAVQEAVEQPREISQELVKAYLARRALDYLVGFNLSPLLWKKAGLSGASAGRVQSPALRMICEREEEIAAFIAREYWTIDAQAEKDAQQFGARLTQFRGEKVEQFTITTAARAEEVRGALNQAAAGNLTVANVDRKQRKRNPAPPFTTSTLQQEAARKLGFGAQRTMRVAQRLYEGMDFGEGPIGLITYMRTDSVNLAVEAVREIRSTIARLYGAEALPDAPRTYRTKSKNAQEAHEAVRPTSPSRTPEQLAGKLDGDELKLYTLIWRRAVASQMEAAVFDTVAVDLEAGEGHAFRANGSTLITPGFLAVYRESFDDAASDDENDRMLPAMEVGDRVKLLEIRPEQHFTEPPPRYSEASLVKALEEHGIGRPSTYASIIQTLLYKKYCELLNQALRADRSRQDRQPVSDRQLRALRRLRLHRGDGGRARQHLPRRRGLGAGTRAVLGDFERADRRRRPERHAAGRFDGAGYRYRSRLGQTGERALRPLRCVRADRHARGRGEAKVREPAPAPADGHDHAAGCPRALPAATGRGADR